MKTMHILSNSHLDREHRHEFQETRLMMVEMLDDVIRIMEADDSYRYFTLDGQAIVLDDYLEMRPHMRPRLQALIRAGRIQIGPWYSLVDCYAVNPESIIRNLVVGRRVCREFGEPMPVGYSIFSFGQMAQLPQVYAGFGIHDIVFYKGASAKAFPQSEFIWRAPDGTEAFATRLGREKRWNFFFDFDIPVLLGGDAKRPGWQSRFTDPVKLCHLIDEENRNQYATELCPDIRIREEKIDGAIRTVLDALDETASAHVLAAFDGTDFTSPLPQIPEVIRLINQRMEGELELVHSTPAAYFEAVKGGHRPQHSGTVRGRDALRPRQPCTQRNHGHQHRHQAGHLEGGKHRYPSAGAADEPGAGGRRRLRQGRGGFAVEIPAGHPRPRFHPWFRRSENQDRQLKPHRPGTVLG